ncbi:MAG: LPXTG cell wall anchor domain-containing protein [Clostridia bacterium]|nr:LPXTG cell wall anchor domain-containing protein [Clostridia bacterium]
MNDSSIAIIGGADGPTAISVAESNPAFLFVALGVAIVSLAVISIVIIKRRKKK